MKQFSYCISDSQGIHARPAGEIVKVAKKYACFSTLWVNEQHYDLKKLLPFMGSNLKFNDEILVVCEGDDEAICAQELEKAFKNNL